MYGKRERMECNKTQMPQQSVDGMRKDMNSAIPGRIGTARALRAGWMVSSGGLLFRAWPPYMRRLFQFIKIDID